MRIQAATTNVQALKAQQAWEARRAAKSMQAAEPKHTPTTRQSAPALQTGPLPEHHHPPTLPGLSQGPASPQWNQTVHEVQTIAARAGYVDVGETDIRRAYMYGESLLADYRV